MTQFSRHTNVVSVYLFLLKKNQVLLSLRKNTGYRDGEYSLPAGHVEAGESCVVAMLREAEEEVGLQFKSEQLHFAHLNHRKSGHDASERIDVFFACREWSGEVKNCEPEKCASLEWCAVDALPENIVPVVRQALEKFLADDFYSEYGW